MAAPVITRGMLQRGEFARLIGEGIPGLRILSDEERAASLAGLLARRPEREGGAWVFAYGSLIWNPAIDVAEQRSARVHGWHRSFCLSAVAGRGTPERPGLLLGLDRGGACHGVGLRIEEAKLEAELTLLWRREMLAGSYDPRWLRLRDAAGVPFGHAIAFTMRRDGPHYVGKLAENEIVQRLAHASGPVGSGAEYLLQTRDGLRAHGITDRRIERLATQVEAVLDQARQLAK